MELDIYTRESTSHPGYLLPSSVFTEWLFCFVMTVIILILTAYLFLATIFYVVMTANSAANRRISVDDAKATNNLFNGGILLVITLSLLRTMLDLWTEHSCLLSTQINIGLAAGCMACIYFLLWKKHRIFLDGSQIHTRSLLLNVLSWISLVLLIITTVLNGIIFVVYGLSYKEGPIYKCESDTENQWPMDKWITLATSTATFQFVLLGLLIYPLCIHERSMEVTVSIVSSPVKVLLRKLVVIAVLCISSDVVAALISLFVKRPTGEISSMVYTVDIFVNTICVICSFSDWRERLFPFAKFVFRSREKPDSIGACFHA